MLRFWFLAFFFCAVFLAMPLIADDFPRIPRVLPPEDGLEIPAEVKERLTTKIKALRPRIDAIRNSKGGRTPNTLWAEIEIYLKAVDFAILHGEFWNAKDFAKADKLLAAAEERLTALEAGQVPWRTAKGLVVRGFVSRIDGSAQPYGLVIPENINLAADAPKVPLYLFLHGRGDKQTDLHFIEERMRSRGEIHPENAIVLHPFGRQCVGFKSAGEVDVLEATDHVLANYPIDPDKVVLMGFSMGGAGAWHLGAHYAHRWRVVAPGAGFAETAKYQGLKPESVPEYERILWGCYDVPDYVRNLFNLKTIAYSGELDKQIQAARVMEEAFAAEGQKLDHRIGPGVPHKYEPETLKQLLKDIAAEIEKPRPKIPETVFWQSRTLRYAESVQHRYLVNALDEHWQDSRLTATKQGAVVDTKNIRSFTAHPPFPADNAIAVNGQKVELPFADEPIEISKFEGKWQVGDTSRFGLRKTPQVHGPIDDAFLDSFLIVLPSGKSKHEQVASWTSFEAQHFQDRWRALMRGQPRVKLDKDVTPQDHELHHLILWGDADTNTVLRDMAPFLPVKYSADEFEFGGKSYASNKHVPVFIYPNPNSRDKYIVLNSGLTFREVHDRTNSQQNPKLPDWAVLDISEPPTASAAGKVVAADFFDEQWLVKKK